MNGMCSLRPSVFLLATALIYAACDGTAPVRTDSVPEPMAATPNGENVEENGRLGKQFVGCYSNGRSELLRILPNRMIYGSIRDSVANSPKPVGFEVLKESRIGETWIRLIDRPQFFIFQNYVSLELTIHEGATSLDLQERSFQSYADLVAGEPSGYANWLRDDCKKWYPEWFEKHYGLDKIISSIAR